MPDPENPETKRTRLEFMKAAARYMNDQFKQRRHRLMEQRRQQRTICISTSDSDVIGPKNRVACYRDEFPERSTKSSRKPGGIDDVYSKVLDIHKDGSEVSENKNTRYSMYQLEECEGNTRRAFVSSSIGSVSESNQSNLNSVETHISEQTIREGDNNTTDFCNVETNEVKVDAIQEADFKNHITNTTPNQRKLQSDRVMTDIILNKMPIISTCSRYAQSRGKTVKIKNTCENEESRNVVRKRRANRKCRKRRKTQDNTTDKLELRANAEYTANEAKLVIKTETENFVERPNRKRCHSEKQSKEMCMGGEYILKNRSHCRDTSEISIVSADTIHKPANKPHGTRSTRKGITVDASRAERVEYFEKYENIDGKLIRRGTLGSITNDQEKCIFDSRTCNFPECYVILRRVKVLDHAITR